jgi:hypothetical protein
VQLKQEAIGKGMDSFDVVVPPVKINGVFEQFQDFISRLPERRL